MLRFEWIAGIIVINILIIFITEEPVIYDLRRVDDSPEKEAVVEKRKMKYILQWSNPKSDPFYLMGEGQDQFLKRRCPVNNCYITPHLSSLRCVTDFDAILFYGPEFCQKNVTLPNERSPHQKYVFVSRESPMYYPLKLRVYDGIFNWTYTYKLNSDIYFGFIIIKNSKGEVIGPKKDMHWLDVKDMIEIDSDFKNMLRSKKLAAAWFVSNCCTMSLRENLALQLRTELAKYNLVLDIYTENCEWKKTKKCPKDPRTNRARMDCLQKIETDYYFYLAFENSLSEDYVTEKLLNAVQHYAVPIVYGGANYTRFLPEGSYLDARELGVRRLVLEMIKAITEKKKYYEFFKWTNHYSYHHIEEVLEADYMCALCRAVNDEDLVKKISVYKKMRSWWRAE